MLVSSFFVWFEQGAPHERAEAVDMLAAAYLTGILDGDSPSAVEAALTLVLDDPSRLVRRTLACAFADAPNAPRHVILALANDHPEVAVPMLARSPILQDADLIDMAISAEPRSLLAMALRLTISEPVAAALIARSHRDTALALAGNAMAEIADADLHAMAVKFGGNAKFREVLLRRGSLPSAVRHHLLQSMGENLSSFLTEGGFLAKDRALRLVGDALQQGTLTIAAGAQRDLAEFVQHLRQTAQLTPGLLLRSVLGGDLQLLVQALAELTELPVSRVSSLVRGRADATLAALFRRAGLPDFLQNPLIAAVRSAQELGPVECRQNLSLQVIRAAQAACFSLGSGEDMRLLALLRRYEAEAARAQSRRLGEMLREQTHADRAALARSEQHDLGLLSLAGNAHDSLASIEDGERALKDGQTMVPATEPPRLDPIPDLKTLITNWQRERASRKDVSGDGLIAPPANQEGAFDSWQLRRSVA
ncbi:Protein of unknown function DUF2336 [Rhabdaerophilaceae bacterium]